MQKVLRFWKCHPEAILPTHGKDGDIGYDLHAAYGWHFHPGEQRSISTGVKVVIPKGYYGRIAERGGMANKGFAIGGGVIDPNYRGELMVIVRFVPKIINELSVVTPVVISAGQAIAQLILERADDDFIPMWDDGPIPESNRGEQRFNSSGR